MAKLIFILGDQLSLNNAALKSASKQEDVICMAELIDECSYAPHHIQKVAFILTAMRQYAETLEQKGWTLHYHRLGKLNSFNALVHHELSQGTYTEFSIQYPGEHRVKALFEEAANEADTPLTWFDNPLFFSTPSQFREWAQGRKQLRMEYYYRELRKKHSILMQSHHQPFGGKWNYDQDNRKAYDQAIKLPILPKNNGSDHPALKAVIKDINKHVKQPLFGRIDYFPWVTQRSDALKKLNHFIKHRLPYFGTYQDAMLHNHAFLFHSLISPYLNTGLLSAHECCEKAEQAYLSKQAPLNAVEGFIRQVLGWREYIYGYYWFQGPAYHQQNFFEHNHPLPSFYWTAETNMLCIRSTIEGIQKYAYAHHILRLMITGNFALLAKINPQDVCNWYLGVFIDAFEWVELPNTLGMALYGDGGALASKPYIASGNYINKMSDFCKACIYSPKESITDIACPFNALYWGFIGTHQSKLKCNPRMSMPIRTWGNFNKHKQQALLSKSSQLIESIEVL